MLLSSNRPSKKAQFVAVRSISAPAMYVTRERKISRAWLRVYEAYNLWQEIRWHISCISIRKCHGRYTNSTNRSDLRTLIRHLGAYFSTFRVSGISRCSKQTTHHIGYLRYYPIKRCAMRSTRHFTHNSLEQIRGISCNPRWRERPCFYISDFSIYSIIWGATNVF